MKKSERGAGVLLVELLIVITCSIIILSASVTPVLKLRAIDNQKNARMRLQTIANMKLNIALCQATVGCTPNLALLAALPAPGSVSQGGYVFSYTAIDSVSWTYVAVPISSGFTGNQVYFTSQDGVVRCGTSAGAQPCQ